MSDLAISMQGVGKRYDKLQEQAMLLRSLLPFARTTKTEFWALRNFDLDVEEGGVLGIIGRNGAGKTTLLRMLAGVTQPSEGRVTVRGRVAPLISVGVGFHQEMSGRENVYVNGMLLGLTKAQVEQRFDEIVTFAELGDFIDTPVKFYSSGMFMRLGFSVAIHTDPQVLLVDEVLAVGDLSFQLKCLEKMKAIRASGVTIVMVSHAMAAIRLLCPRAIVVRHGAKVFDGEVEAAIAHHHEVLSEEAADSPPPPGGGATVIGGVTILDTELLGPDGGVSHHVAPGAEVTARARVRFDTAVDDPTFAFTIVAPDGNIAYAKSSPPKHTYRSFAAGTETTVEMRFKNHLGGGSYRLTSSATTSDGRGVLATDHRGVTFFVDSRFWTRGVADLDGELSVGGEVLDEGRDWGLGEDPAPAPLSPLEQL